MHSMAPRPCFFIIARARSVRYLRSRSQLTRCCQSMPAMPKFAPIRLSHSSLYVTQKPCSPSVRKMQVLQAVDNSAGRFPQRLDAVGLIWEGRGTMGVDIAATALLSRSEANSALAGARPGQARWKAQGAPDISYTWANPSYAA